jgi:hypothetical protein
VKLSPFLKESEIEVKKDIEIVDFMKISSTKKTAENRRVTI